MATILSATATFFAAFVAIILYTNWRAPQYLQKISYESREIFKVSRQLKLKADQLLELVNTRLATTNLNNDNTDSLKYKSIIKNLLDDIDDLANLLVMYKYNFNSKISFENEHLLNIEPFYKSLTELHQTLSTPHYIEDYISSAKQVIEYVKLGDFEEDIRNITINLIDIISKFHVDLLKK